MTIYYPFSVFTIRDAELRLTSCSVCRSSVYCLVGRGHGYEVFKRNPWYVTSLASKTNIDVRRRKFWKRKLFWSGLVIAGLMAITEIQLSNLRISTGKFLGAGLADQARSQRFLIPRRLSSCRSATMTRIRRKGNPNSSFVSWGYILISLD